MSSSAVQPTPTDVPTIAWLTSTWIWMATAMLAAWLVLLIGVLGAVRYDHGVVATVSAALTEPWTVLSVFLAARALVFVLAQRRRDYDVRAGQLAVTDDTSIGAIVSVASFSTIGLLAAAVPLPLLYSASGNYRLLATGVAAVAVPTSYVLLVYQLGEQAAADRYRRGFRVTPAVYHYLWTLPVVVLVWMVATGVGPVPVETGRFASVYDPVVGVGPPELFYAAVWTPAALAYGYTMRRQVERVARGLVPGW